MARLDHVITNIVDIFQEYAEDEGKKNKLNKEELKKVLQQEIQSPELKVSDAKQVRGFQTFRLHIPQLSIINMPLRIICYILTSGFVHFLLII